MANKNDIKLPDNIKLFNRGSYIEIVRRWFGFGIIGMTIFAILVNNFLINNFSRLVDTSDPFSIGFVIIIGTIGVYITYHSVAGWFNKTHIFVSHGKMAIRHTPIPWLGNKELVSTNVRRLYVKEKIRRSSGGNGPSSTTVTYEAHCDTYDGKDTKLLAGLPDRQQALYIEQEIEKYLDIEDMST